MPSALSPQICFCFNLKPSGNQCCFTNGAGVTRDHKAALKWFRLASEQGDTTGQYNLGAAYENGQGVPQDYVLAEMWFNIAAAAGEKAAINARDFLAKRMTPLVRLNKRVPWRDGVSYPTSRTAIYNYLNIVAGNDGDITLLNSLY